MKVDAAPKKSTEDRSAGARAVVHDVIRRRDQGESVSDTTVEAAHAELMPQLAEELERAHRLEEAHRRAGCDPSVPTGEWPKPGEPGTPISLTPSDESDNQRIANTSIPGYRILRELAGGGQGSVYEALHLNTGGRVAIKVLLGGPLAGPRDRRRFELEVHILAKLKHPNIVSVHDSGSANGALYCVMDYISGQPLDTYVKNNQLSIDSLLELFRTICDAVNVAHLKGVTHRDLKPDNVLVAEDGTPYVLDFGLAKVATEHVMDGSGARWGTLPGRFIGTLPWASPEQAEGRPDKVDTRSDVYSLGVLLFQMLTKRFPYDVAGNLPDVIQNILTVEPESPRSISRQISRDLELIVLKCLEKPRERRYQMAGLLRDDIDNYRANRPISAQPESILYLIRKAAARNKFAAVVLGLVGVIFVSSTIMSARFYLRESDAQASFALQLQDFERRKAEFELLNSTFEGEVAGAVAGLEEVRRWNAFHLFLAFWRKGLDRDARDAAANPVLRAAPFDAAVAFLLDDKPLEEKVEPLRARLDQANPDGGSAEARRALAGLVIAEHYLRDGDASTAVTVLNDAREALRGKSGSRERWLDRLIRQRLATLEQGETE